MDSLYDEDPGGLTLSELCRVSEQVEEEVKEVIQCILNNEEVECEDSLRSMSVKEVLKLDTLRSEHPEHRELLKGFAQAFGRRRWGNPD